MMPYNLVLVRHGQSEANVIQQADKNGTPYTMTEDLVNVPDRSWRLTSDGVEQAKAAGKWIQDNIGHFDRHITSPFTRTRETAAHLNIPDAMWEENRSVRERSWGDIGSITRKEFREKYPENSLLKNIDPLYWFPPSGESIANVAENRTRSVLNMVAQENSRDNVLIVTHGEFLWSTRLVLERWSDEEFLSRDKDPEDKIHNCTIFHYMRENPETGEVHKNFKWVRIVHPYFDDETKEWGITDRGVERFGREYLTNKQLLERAESRSRYL